MVIDKHDRILLQGDSITDAMRDRSVADPNDPRGMGSGYAFIAASRLLAERPNDGLAFYNRGISGDKVFQLADRWERDCLSLKPNLLSILVGVNDIGHKIGGTYDGTFEVYERDYRGLLERTRRELPNARLVICEPFVLSCGAVDGRWFPEFEGYRAAARRLAEAFGATFVPFQAAFDEAARKAPPEYWAPDGVHPTMAGHHLMAQTWLKAVTPQAGS
jgi:lysophospholipase L1-like esterase